jgi:toxin ParE1/3/4
MTFKVIISASAKADLFAIYDYIADRAGADIAFRFVEAIEAYYLGFAHSPERGTRRDDLRAGLRTVGSGDAQPSFLRSMEVPSRS